MVAAGRELMPFLATISPKTLSACSMMKVSVRVRVRVSERVEKRCFRRCLKADHILFDFTESIQ